MKLAPPPTPRSRKADATAPSFVLAVALFTAAVIAWTVWDVLRTQDHQALAKTGSTLHQPADALAARYRVVGRDRNNRTATFDVVIFPRHLQWAAGSAATIAAPGRWLTEWQVPAQLFDAEVRNRLRGAKAVIAIGTADETDAAPSPRVLAGLRAQTAGRWLKSIVPPTTALRSVNLGLYAMPCARCENPIVTWQRPLAFAIVAEAATGTDLPDAFKNALMRTTNLPDPNHFTAYAWVHVPR